MKNLKKTSIIVLVFILPVMQFSCNQSKETTDYQPKIKNTLKSVSFFQDSIGVDPNQLHADFEKVNAAIDSIGYPDAGYKLWEVVSDDTLEFRFMVEGYWPDEETYELIHNHELYKKATNIEDASWSGLKNTWYHRFKKIGE